MITLRQLRYLTSLARHRHFGRAAADCAVSQPALSMQVRELEREIGAELVERRPGEIALNDTGLDVAQRAEQILAATRDLVDFARHRDLLSGRLRLGIIPTLAPYVLPRLLPRLQADYPQLRLEVRETQTKLLLDELARGELDAVMLALPVEGADMETLALFDDAFVLAVPAGDALPARGRVGVADVDQRRLILLEEGHCLRDQALAFCAAPKLAASSRDAPAGLGATSLATVMQMVANGYGVTLLAGGRGRCRGARYPREAFALQRAGAGAHRRPGLAAHLAAQKDFKALGKIVRRRSAWRRRRRGHRNKKGGPKAALSFRV